MKKDINTVKVKPVETVVTPEPMNSSPTSILTYKSCPRQFYYRYIRKLKIPINIHLIKGNVLHKVFEELFKKKSYYKKNLEEVALALLERAWKKKKEELDSLRLTPEDLEIERVDCVNMVNSYIYKIRMDMNLLIHIKKAKNEAHAYMLVRPQFKEVYLADKELRLRGYVDRIHIDFDGKTWIGDYKTSSKYGLGIKEDYELQCGIYALLYHRVLGKNADWTSIIYFRYGQEVSTRVSPTRIKFALDAVMEVRNKTDATRDKKDYPLKESKLCKWCNFFDRCSGIRDVEDELRRKQAIAEFKKNKEAKK